MKIDSRLVYRNSDDFLDRRDSEEDLADSRADRGNRKCIWSRLGKEILLAHG